MIPEHVPPPVAEAQAAAVETTAPDFTLVRDTFGHLILSRPGMPDTVVIPVRSFPISGPDEGISLVGPQAQELAWIDRLDTLPANAQKLITEELAQREFKPEILRIEHASTWATPSRWDIETDRGPAVLTLKSEDDIRRLSASTLLIADACGVHYLVRDLNALDRFSRKILDHFL
ncbi:DUF1854 domain-containing protein [Castellaniella sp. MT123]|uniref:cyanophycin metabolism-associated DUF1854 family protein n=1 Tax=Castellaniella sp. MT123 TaxID=3140381 RepID=UPI0031F37A86